MNRAQKRQIERTNLKTVQKNTVAKMMQQKPTKGFGITITNNKVAILFWDKVLKIWERKA